MKTEKRKRSGRKTAVRVIIILLGVVLVLGGILAGVILASNWHNAREGADGYADIAEAVLNTANDPAGDTAGDAAGGSAGGNAEDDGFPDVDFAALVEINPDVIGWLRCEDTVIDYPLVQGRDNIYYLNHHADRSGSKVGALFADYRCVPFHSRNTVIYGHNIQRGDMLHCLLKYKEQAYYDAHPVMQISTPGFNYTLQLVSAFELDVTRLDSGVFFDAELDEEEALLQFVSGIAERSCFTPVYTATVTDNFVTLATCDYDYSDARFVVVGRLLV